MRREKTSALQKMFVKMMAKLIFERAVMLGTCIFPGSPVFIKLRNSFRNYADSIVMHHDIRPLIVIVS